jgi:hypothetical protein
MGVIMSDEEQVETEEVQTEQEETTDRDVVSKEEYEAIRKAQAGSDKKVKELQSKLNEFQQMLEQKSQKEKTAEEQLQELKQQLAAKEQRELRYKKLTDAGMPELSKLFEFDTSKEDGLEEWINTMQELIDQKAKMLTDSEIKKRFSNSEPPKTGEGVSGKLSLEDIKNMSKEEFAKLDLNNIEIKE